MSSTPRWLRFKKIHYYLIPLVALVVWWGMLIALMSAWSIQGHPIYWFMGETDQNPVYISDIGATNLQPLFISCTGFQLIFFVGTLLMEYVLRRMKKLQPYVSNKQPWFAIVSIICAVIGQLGILFVSIFNTRNFHTVHITMVGVFIFFIFWACFFNFLNSFIFGNFPQRLHPNHERVIFGKHRWANLYMVSFFFKLLWLIVAVILAAFFGYEMKHDNDSISACFEWTISFWYGLLLVFWAIDLFPSAVKHYRIRHPEQYPAFVDRHKEPMAEVHDPNNDNSFQPIPKRYSSSSGVRDDTTLENSPRIPPTLRVPQPLAVPENPYDGVITVPVEEVHTQSTFDNQRRTFVPPTQTYTGEPKLHEYLRQQMQNAQEQV